ncbi:MAG TPA: hypothetical protein VNB90_10535 [Cytophagaceae bacterium]|jgi:hypothetical protein|nr:hypothetical protein [Cytophagaceae bacterium]
MTDREYEILDALYFTISFEGVKKELQTEETQLRDELLALIEKGWVKCLEKITEKEIELALVKNNYKEYNYLASKKGLLAHNSR